MEIGIRRVRIGNLPHLPTICHYERFRPLGAVGTIHPIIDNMEHLASTTIDNPDLGAYIAVGLGFRHVPYCPLFRFCAHGRVA